MTIIDTDLSLDLEVEQVSCLKYLCCNIWLDCFYGIFVDEPICNCCEQCGSRGEPSGHHYGNCYCCMADIEMFDIIMPIIVSSICCLFFSGLLIFLTIPLIISMVNYPIFAYIIFAVIVLGSTMVACILSIRCCRIFLQKKYQT